MYSCLVHSSGSGGSSAGKCFHTLNLCLERKLWEFSDLESGSVTGRQLPPACYLLLTTCYLPLAMVVAQSQGPHLLTVRIPEFGFEWLLVLCMTTSNFSPRSGSLPRIHNTNPTHRIASGKRNLAKPITTGNHNKDISQFENYLQDLKTMDRFLRPSDGKIRESHWINNWASLVLCRLEWQGSWDKGPYTCVVQRSSSTLVHSHAQRLGAWGCGSREGA